MNPFPDFTLCLSRWAQNLITMKESAILTSASLASVFFFTLHLAACSAVLLLVGFVTTYLPARRLTARESDGRAALRITRCRDFD